MIKQVYDNRIDEILDYLKKRIINEALTDNIEELINDYEKMANLQIRSIEINQNKDNEILKRLEKDLMYRKGLEDEFTLLNNQSNAREENKLIINYLENFLKGV